MELEGRIAVVTGGGTGIGRGIAEALADAGCTVIIGGRREAPLKAVSGADRDIGAIAYHTLDVADRESVSRFFDWVQDNYDAPSILVNCAGINVRNRDIESTDPDEWEKVVAVNLHGAFYCIQAVLRPMKAAGEGLIVNISSIAGKRALPMAGVAYSASKFGMTSLSASVALSLAEFGIRVTNVFPGEANTEILDQRPNPVPQEKKEQMVQPEDIGAVVTTIARLPTRAHVPEIIIKPLYQEYL